MAAANTTIAAANGNISSLASGLVGVETSITSLAEQIAAASTAVVAIHGVDDAHTGQIASLVTNLTALTATVAAAEAAFVSLSNIISGQETSGMGPIVPVPFPRTEPEQCGLCARHPLGGGKTLSAGHGQPFVSPISTVPFSVSARVKTTSTGVAQVAAGQLGLFWIGCDAAGNATAHFGNGGTAGGAPASDITVGSTTHIADGAFHALELDITAGGAILFVDGTAVGTSDQIVHFYGANPFGIRDLGGQRGTTLWLGEMCEVAVWPLAKHTTNYTLTTAPYSGSEGITALHHLNGYGSDAMEMPFIQIGNRPAVASGIRFFLQAGDSVTSTVQPIGSSQAASASNQVTVTGPVNPEWYESFTANLMLFITRIAGAPLCRWLALPVIGQEGQITETFEPASTTTHNAAPTVVDTILITGRVGSAANISGIVMARRLDTGDACSFDVAAVVRNFDTPNALIDQQTMTAFYPPASMTACTLTIGVFGTTITLTAMGLENTDILWRSNLETMVL